MRLKKSFLIAVCLCAWSLIIIIIYNEFVLIRRADAGQDARHVPIEFNDKRSKRWFMRNRATYQSQAENRMLHERINAIESNNLWNTLKRPRKLEKYPPKNVTTTKKVRTDLDFENSVVIDDDKSNNKYDSNMIDNSDQLIGTNETESAAGSNLDEHAQLIARLHKLHKKSEMVKGPIIAVLVIACNRISVKSCLDDLVRYRPNAHQFPIIVSQVCIHLIQLHHFPISLYLYHDSNFRIVIMSPPKMSSNHSKMSHTCAIQIKVIQIYNCMKNNTEATIK